MKPFPVKFLAPTLIAIGVGLATESVAIGAAMFAIFCIVFWAPVYTRYAKDNPEGVWFKRKLFGWGWTPVTWQGWPVILLFAVVVIQYARGLDPEPDTKELGLFFAKIIFALIILFIICYKKGEKP